jgi:transcriptional regulator with XRE-family HTH domain
MKSHIELDGIKVAGEANPTLRRRELGFLLRQLRLDRRLSLEEAAEGLLFSTTKLSRLETGRSGAFQRDIRAICQFYQVDPAECQRLMTLAREGKQRGWWQEYALPYATYVGLEDQAASISEYKSDIVSGLLQVEDYARAVLRAMEPPLDEATIERQVEARVKRQAVLTKDNGPRFHCILDEAALRRPVGGPAVMRAQLERIIDRAGQGKVTFQLIPLGLGAHPGLESNFIILDFETPMINDVVYVDGLVGNIYLEDASDLQRYKHIFARLHSIALSPEESISLVKRIAGTYGDI